ITSLVGGIAFAFSSYMTVWLEWGNIGHTLLWLPLMFFSIRQTIIKKNISSSILFVVAATCCVLAGYIQGAFYVFCVSALYGVCLLIQQKKKKLWWYIVLLFIIPVGLCALQILPTITIFLSSTRGAYSSSQIHNLL